MVSWVLFDLNGTLLDPTPVGEPAGLGPRGGETVLAAAAHASMVDTMSGTYRPLPELLRAALEREVALQDGLEEGIEEALQRAAAMPPFPDAAAAFGVLRGAGVRVGVLTNSATEAAEAALGSAGLEPELVVGSDSVEVYKPDRRVYDAGVEATGGRAEDVCLVAAHWWDVLGARRAGLRTAWVARKERVLMPGTGPEWTGEDLLATAQAITCVRNPPGQVG